MRDIVVLFSGGLDSTVVAHMAGDRLHSVFSVSYGQPHGVNEGMAAERWAMARGVHREVVVAPVAGVEAMEIGAGTPGPRLLPGRNLLLLSLAVNYAAARGASEVWMGANADDAADYPDCRREFVEAMSELAIAAYGIGVSAPLSWMTKREVVAKARELGVDIDATWSCYQPRGGVYPCGTCNACRLRAGALSDACPRCGSADSMPCHDSSGFGADHPGRSRA